MKKNLDEISFIRPILIILLVLYHAFAPWCGAWRSFNGFIGNDSYWWIGKAAYSFMLPTFVFISSYVFAFQKETLKSVEGIKVLMLKKFNRLIIPSIIFSVFYLPLIPENGGGQSVLMILNGAGHMWFLPMLFWCFPFMNLLLKIKKPIVRLYITLLFAVGPVLPLPLQIGESFSYMFYFLLGYELYKNIDLIKVYTTTYNVALSWIIFMFSFVGLTILKRNYLGINEDNTILLKLVKLSFGNVSTMIYSTLGVLSMLLSAIKITSRFKLTPWIIKLGTYCFGVYVFQQFILQIMYYHTEIPQQIDNRVLPWVGFLVAIIFSLLFSYLLRLTRIGRRLI